MSAARLLPAVVNVVPWLATEHGHLQTLLEKGATGLEPATSGIRPAFRPLVLVQHRSLPYWRTGCRLLGKVLGELTVGLGFRLRRPLGRAPLPLPVPPLAPEDGLTLALASGGLLLVAMLLGATDAAALSPL